MKMMNALEGEGPPEPEHGRLARRLALQIEPKYRFSAVDDRFMVSGKGSNRRGHFVFEARAEVLQAGSLPGPAADKAD